MWMGCSLCCCTGVSLYFLGSELWSAETAPQLFQRCADHVVHDAQAQHILGSPIHAVGIASGSRRSAGLAYNSYQVGNEVFLRGQFRVQGAFKPATVHFEFRKVRRVPVQIVRVPISDDAWLTPQPDGGEYEFRYLMLESPGSCETPSSTWRRADLFRHVCAGNGLPSRLYKLIEHP
jgi:hypothetical protein